MRLKTIWTLKGLPLRERLRRTGETLTLAAAHHLPRRLVYWTVVDVGVRTSSANPDAEVPALTMVDLLKHAAKEAGL